MATPPLPLDRPDPAMAPVDLRSRLIETFRWIDPGDWCDHLLTDRSGWWRDPVVLAGLGPALADLCPAPGPTLVVAPATSGYLLGPLVAVTLGVGFVEAYRDLTGPQLADNLLIRPTAPGHDGRSSTLGMRARHIGPDDRVLVVDDWVETGAQLDVLADLVARAGAQYLGAAVIVDGAEPAVRTRLGVRGLLHESELDVRLPRKESAGTGRRDDT